MFPDAILLAGGEIDYGNDNVERLVDYWFLDTRTFQVQKLMNTLSKIPMKWIWLCLNPCGKLMLQWRTRVSGHLEQTANIAQFFALSWTAPQSLQLQLWLKSLKPGELSKACKHT